jgi:ectoine hydroxylase-related dioxygenase (phytanoyl-CoA dioxygenase family)
MTAHPVPHIREQLIQGGFCVIPRVLNADIIERMRSVTDRLLARQSDEHFKLQRSTGSMIDVLCDPAMAELIAHPGAIAALQALEFANPKFASGYIISKPPHSPQLFWHQDWWGWDDPGSYDDLPAQLFLMYYLVDTNRQNGCLRVIPGSHRRRHPLHDQIGVAHQHEISRAQKLDTPEFQPAAGEQDVSVSAGDLVIGDSRILHASHSNNSAHRRTVITLWYYPDFAALSEGLRAAMMQKWREHQQRASPEAIARLPASLIPAYNGNAIGVKWNRNPGAALRSERSEAR